MMSDWRRHHLIGPLQTEELNGAPLQLTFITARFAPPPRIPVTNALLKRKLKKKNQKIHLTTPFQSLKPKTWVHKEN